jgi:hypothetical protein
MASWAEVAVDAPELAATVRARFGSHRHAVLATLRHDGFPRMSGVETQFALGELWMGMMPGSRKAADLRRDPRFGLHSALDLPEIPHGDATVTGRAVEVTDRPTIDAWAASLGGDPPGSFDLFRVDVRRVSLLQGRGDHLVIGWWAEGEGVREVQRT